MSEDWGRIRLGDLLVDDGILTEDILNQALGEQKLTKMRLGEVLHKNDWLNERQIAMALSKQLKLPFITLADYKPSPETIKLIPESVAQRLKVFPLAILEPGKIAIAMSDPLHENAIDELRMITNADFEISIATESDVRRAQVRFYKVQVSDGQKILNSDSEKLKQELNALEKYVSEVEKYVVFKENKITFEDPEKISLQISEGDDSKVDAYVDELCNMMKDFGEMRAQLVRISDRLEEIGQKLPNEPRVSPLARRYAIILALLSSVYKHLSDYVIWTSEVRKTRSQ